MVGIYKITSPTGKVYIGQSTNIEQRFQYYKKLNCVQQVKLFRSLQKYKPENHNFEIIEECEESRLNLRERYWQEQYDVLNREKGLNLRYTKINSKSGTMSEETKARMSISKTGEKNPIHGKTHSEETRRKISEKRKGHKHSEETKKLYSQQRSGIPKSEEHKKKQSDRQKISEKNTFRHVVKCPYCNKEGQKPNMYRWHFENCKQIKT